MFFHGFRGGGGIESDGMFVRSEDLEGECLI